MSRLEVIRKITDVILDEVPDPLRRRQGVTHLYGVAALSTMLAMKRRLDAELAATAGMLHDIYIYRTGLTRYHADNSAEDARVVLRDTGLFTDAEISVIVDAVLRHSDKHLVEGPYAELLKDADVLERALYDPRVPVSASSAARLRKVLEELSLEIDVKVDADRAETSTPCYGNRRELLADIAENLAQRPLIGNEFKSGPDVYPLIRYFPGATLNVGWDWCACFVYHCCMESGFHLPIRYPAPGIGRFAGVKA